MRTLTKLLLPLALALVLAACNAPGGLVLPKISITPATKPFISVTETVSPIATAATADANATTNATATSAETTLAGSPSPTPAPVRTPLRLKAPSPTSAIATETPAAEPIASGTPTATTAAETPAALPLDTATPIAAAATTTIADTPAAEVTTAPTQPLPPANLDNTLNVLMVGSDERSYDGGPWRSDVIMVVAVDFARRQIGVISFPRDLWVSIPTVGDNRINTATFWGEANKYDGGGGIGLLRDTIEKNFGIRIDDYVKINFDSFQDLVDALGGIDVVVDCPIAGRFPREPGSKELVYQTLQPGKYHMDGFFALRYARERKSTSDVDRARRQQRVLIAVRNKAREINIIPRLPALYAALRDTIETDLGLTDIIALGRLGILIDPKDAHGFIIDFKYTDSWTTPEGAMVLLPQTARILDKIGVLFEQPSILESPSKPRACQE